MSATQNPLQSHFHLLALCAVLLAIGAYGQPRRTLPDFRERSEVTVALSSDGSTLAIARSSVDAVQRNGRVELWDAKTGQLLRTITGFDGPVWSVSFLQDGKTLITASTEFRESKIQSKPRDRKGIVLGELKWWDTRTGAFKQKISLPVETSNSSVEATVSPNSNELAVVARYLEFDAVTSNTIRGSNLELLDAETGHRKVKYGGGLRPYYGGWFSHFERPLFSPDGKLLAASSVSEVKLWRVNGDQLLTLKKFQGRPIAIAFSPDSRILAVASTKAGKPWEVTRGSEISLWDVSTGKRISKVDGKNDLVSGLQFVSDGRVLLIGSLHYEPERTVGTVKMWDLRTNLIASLNVHEGEPVSSITLLPDQSALVLQSGLGVEIRDVASWKVKHSFETTDADAGESRGQSRFLLSAKRVVSVAFSPDGTTVSGEIAEEGIRLWDQRTGAVKKRLNVHTADSAVAVSANGRVVAELGAKEVRLWDLTDGTSAGLPFPSSEKVSALALSPDGKTLALGADHEIRLSQTLGEYSTRKLDGHGSAVDLLVFSSNGETLVSADEEGTIKSWNVATGQLKKTISTTGRITALGINASAQMLASAGDDYLISLWDLNTGAQLSTLKKHNNVVNALVFSPDGKMLASGGDDRTAILWEIVSRKAKQTLKGHDFTVTSLAFSPDGQLIASGSGNASVVLWNVMTGKLDRILR